MAPFNILYIHSHDTGRCISPFGYNVATPNLQDLAEDSVLFRKTFCAAPTCSPSRAGLLTGSSPHNCGMLGLTHRGFEVDREKHLANYLKENGYSTHLRGVQHVTTKPEACGYDTVIRHTSGDSISAGSSSALAAQFLDSAPSEPFFLSVGFTDTHREFMDLESDDEARYVQPPALFPDTGETRKDWACFKKSVRRLDMGMGEVFNALKRNGLYDNTLIICTTDHGIAFPRMKCNLTDAGMGVFLIMKGPLGGTVPQGVVNDSLVSQIDIFPTICDMLGTRKPDWLQGQSLLGIISGEQQEVNGQVFGEVTFHAAYEPMRCVRTSRYKYIRRFGDREELTRPNIDESLTKSQLMEFGFGKFEQEREQLYDLMLDPQELRNLAVLPEFSEILSDLSNRLDDWMQRTEDPLLQGYVPMPPGAKVTDPDEPQPNGKLIINDTDEPMRP